MAANAMTMAIERRNIVLSSRCGWPRLRQGWTQARLRRLRQVRPGGRKHAPAYATGTAVSVHRRTSAYRNGHLSIMPDWIYPAFHDGHMVWGGCARPSA